MKKILFLILEIITIFILEVGCVAFGWNICLTRLFDLPKFNFLGCCIFTIALNFISVPVSFGSKYGK